MREFDKTNIVGTVFKEDGEEKMKVTSIDDEQYLDIEILGEEGEFSKFEKMLSLERFNDNVSKGFITLMRNSINEYNI